MQQAAGVLNDVSAFSDDELLGRLHRLVCADRTLSAKLLVHLGEVDARGLYKEQAYASMFEYAVVALHMSEAEAYLRIQAARLGRRFPLVVELLGQGALHLTTIKLLGPHLTLDNHAQLLERARGKRKREVEWLVAEIAPQPDVPSRMRKLPGHTSSSSSSSSVGGNTPQVSIAVRSAICRAAVAPSAATPNVDRDAPLEPQTESAIAPTTHEKAPECSPFTLHAPRVRAASAPLSPGRFKLQVTLGQAAHDKLEQLRDLLRHQVPDGDLANIVELAVDTLLAKTLKQRFAQTSIPRKPRPTKLKPKPRVRSRRVPSRYIPRAVVREVHARDGERCTFVSPHGRRCTARAFLELHHHDTPYAHGGEATTDNLRLTCRLHNALFAERDFGKAFMRAKLREVREQRDPTRGNALQRPLAPCVSSGRTNSVQNVLNFDPLGEP